MTSLKHAIKWMIRPRYRQECQEHQAWEAIRNTPNRTTFTTNVLGSPLEIVDNASFIPMHREIYTEHIYRFKADSPSPYIIDCGANIGISILYFKKMYPACEVLAFEADPTVCESLTRNLKNFNISDVNVINKAVWNEDTTLQFAAHGSDSGRVATSNETVAIRQVEALRLRPYLQRPVDFLKIDIEGAETSVLEDCADLLGNVKNLFVEYHSFVNEEQTLDTLLRIVKQAGFRVYIRSAHDLSPTPFFQRISHIGMDLQLNIFCYRDMSD